MRFIVILLFLAILASLAVALVAMFRRDEPHRMVKALTWRIGLSVLLFVLLLLAWALGLIEPHGLAG